jgi:hypothetical protein
MNIISLYKTIQLTLILLAFQMLHIFENTMRFSQGLRNINSWAFLLANINVQ